MSKIILLLFDFLGELDAGDHHTCVYERLKAKHLLHSVLYASVVLFNNIVEVSAGSNAHLLVMDLSVVLSIPAPLGVMLHRRRALWKADPHAAAKHNGTGFRSPDIVALAEEEVDRLSVLVHRSV